MAQPNRLDPHQLHRFYAGGPAIAALRGIPSMDDHAPEDWVGSTTTLFGEERLGLSGLPDGRLLRDAIVADPEAWLGSAHVERFGADPALLVKLLDAGERLPVHVHPDRAFARRHLDCPYGKTEAWVVAETRGDAVVYLGFTRDLDAAELAGWVDRQDTDAMLAAMHRIPVQPGDGVLVPAGTPHAIGAGVLLVELQEPTDFSVLLEWESFEVDGRADGHLGLGFDLALQAVDRSGRAREALEDLRLRNAPRVLPPEADPFFRAERVGGGQALDEGFSIVVVLAGEGRVGRLPVARGATVVIPAAAGEVGVDGTLEAIRCRPADPREAS
jgi:mannose-6-phosphate isomerase